MDSSPSSNTTNNDLVKLESNVVDNSSKSIEVSSSSVAGRKSEDAVAELMKLSSDEDEEESSGEFSLVEEEEMEEDSDEEESDEEEEDLDEEEEEEHREVMRILEDAAKLKQMAGFFAHPEQTVEMDAVSRARNVFSQPAWLTAVGDADVEFLEQDDDEERAQILLEAKAMEKAAADFMHPERPVLVEATACARNCFSQPWAAEQETFGQAEGRALAVAQTKALKELAVLYQHPEAPLEMDAAARGRNYFTRAAAEDQTSALEEQERTLVLAQTKALKATAVAFMHPEAPVQTDAAAFGRNYYGRASALDQEEEEMADERAILLEEMKELKQAAVDYRHPELPVVTMDAAGAAFGRNYYNRASAEATEASATVDERQRILQEVSQLQSLAKDYMHPEAPLVSTVDATAFGRNYFGRASADEQDEEEYERALILDEMSALKENAVTYRHPENHLEVDPAVFGRNYFGRASSVDKESFGAAEERARIIVEATQLKKMALDYLHPEMPVATDSVAFGRNYYGRASADDYESKGESEERVRTLEDTASLKRLAVNYRHPEKSVDVNDPTCLGRNYFGRASAEEQEDDEHSDDREIILDEMAELRQAASCFMHPERSVTTDYTLSGRNYFGRASAPDQEAFDEAEERVRVLAEVSALKELAVDFAHPELPVATTDGMALGRNYFSRPSAPGDSFDEEAVDEREQVMEDAARLKQLAANYLHPEMSVGVSAFACARNYFSRASAPEQASVDEEQERAAILAEASALKKLAVDYQHPEKFVEVCSSACGRNYFARSSALGVAENIRTSGFENSTEYHSHAEEEHSHHDDYGHFDMDEDLFYDMRQTIVLPGDSHVPSAPKIQSSKMSSDEEGELSRSPSSIMLFTGAMEDVDHPALPSMG